MCLAFLVFFSGEAVIGGQARVFARVVSRCLISFPE